MSARSCLPIPSSATVLASSAHGNGNGEHIALPRMTKLQNRNADPWRSRSWRPIHDAHFPHSSGEQLNLFHYGGVKLRSRFGLVVSASSSSTSSSVGSELYTEEPATKTKFQKSITIPGCSSLLTVLGTGYREKVFAIIGVKVYAAALYVNPSILTEVVSMRGRSEADIQGDLALFQSIYQSRLEKSLHIMLVRDVDGKTFWDALDEAVSPRINAPNATDESALSTFRGIFLGRPMKKGTSIFLTWLEPSKMLVSISSAGITAGVDATIDSINVTKALFDVFFGDTPVSPSLKASVASGLSMAS